MRLLFNTCIIFNLFFVQFVFGQFTTNWPLSTTQNTTPNGYVGIGTKPTSSSTLKPFFDLQVHGTTTYTSGAPSGMAKPNTILEFENDSMAVKSGINYGVTSRIGLTNSLTGQSDVVGGLLQMSQLNFFIKNQSNGILGLSVPSLSFNLSNSNGRAWLGSFTNSSASIYGKMNVISSDNGLYIQTNNSLRYGIRVKTSTDNNNALEVFGQDANKRNFLVTGGGTVYARKYVTTLTAFPDYVFEKNYELMSLSDLRSYIQQNKHLPKIPTANEVEEHGVELGELNRLLVEKVEELTLYILQLEERISKIESK